MIGLGLAGTESWEVTFSWLSRTIVCQ